MKKIVLMLSMLYGILYSYPMDKTNESVLVAFKEATSDLNEVKSFYSNIYDVPFDIEIKDKKNTSECNNETLNGFVFKKCLNFINLKKEYKHWVEYFDDYRYNNTHVNIRNDRYVLDNVSLEFVFDNLNDLKLIENIFFDFKRFSTKQSVLLETSFQYDSLKTNYNIFDFKRQKEKQSEAHSVLNKILKKNKVVTESEYNKFREDFEKENWDTISDFRNFNFELENTILLNKNNVEINNIYIDYLPKDNTNFIFLNSNSEELIDDEGMGVFHAIYKTNIKKVNNKIYLKISISEHPYFDFVRNRYLFILDMEGNLLKKLLEKDKKQMEKDNFEHQLLNKYLNK